MKKRKWLGKGVGICVAAAILVTLAGGAFFYLNESRIPQKTEEQITAEEAKAEAVTVLNEKKGYVGQSDPSVRGDTRKVFRIVEVIPHLACSTFPYLVEWKNEESYDKNVPIGYEGLLWCSAHKGNVQMFSESNVAAANSNPYVSVKGAIKRSYLSEYGTNLGDSTSGLWYREAEGGDTGIQTKNGYFEFVGAGKGTYYIPVSYVAEKDSDRGIHYKVQVIPRKGSEAPKGELYVAEPAYYWPRDINIAKPSYQGKQIRSQTNNNYDCTFKADITGSYRVNTAGLKKKSETDEKSSRAAEDNEKYDYFLAVKDGDENSWDTGYSYFKNGNYSLDESGIEPSEKGNYVRIEDSRKKDGYQSPEMGIAEGYFRLYKEEDGVCPRYIVPFQKKEGNKGFYCANQPDSWKGAECLFQYAGSGKGQYDAIFLYGKEEDEQGYKAEISYVSDQQGRYMLTSTTDTDKKPVLKEDGAPSLPRDYAKIITNINYIDQENWGAKDSQEQSGVTKGGPDGSAPASEYGGWVFHEVSDSSEMKLTRLSAVHKKLDGMNSNTETYFNKGDRIYVTSQVRRNRYYCRDGFANNEWFKLLCYSNHPLDDSQPYSATIGGRGYDFGKTPAENLAMEDAKNLINKFDTKYRLEIIQRKPHELTPEDVKGADLIYISTVQGVEGIAQSWKDINKARVAMGKPELENPGNDETGNFSFTTDITTETLFTIYDECIYDRRVALMVNSNIPRYLPASPAVSNLDKMCFLMTWFRDARDFKYFMPWYEDVREAYSEINRSSGAVKAYKCINIEHDHYDLYNYEHNGETPQNIWDKNYFSVYSSTGRKLLNFDDSGQNSLGEVYGEECKYLTEYYGVKAFKNPDKTKNIWQILYNRDRSELVVDITNASPTAEATPRWVIYADEFDPESFNVKYKIRVEEANGKPVPALVDTKVFFDDNDNNVWEDPGEGHYNMGGQVYDTEYTINVRNGFAEGGSDIPSALLDPAIRMRKLVVEAKDAKGRTAQDEVWIIIREAFPLN